MSTNTSFPQYVSELPCGWNYTKGLIGRLSFNFDFRFMILSVSILKLNGLHSAKILLLAWLGCLILLGSICPAFTNLLIHKTIKSLLRSNQVRLKTSD